MSSQALEPTQQGQLAILDLPLWDAVANLYGRGHTRAQIARLLVDRLAPDENAHGPRTAERKLKTARMRLRLMEQNEKFRDKVYGSAMVKLDMELPAVLDGMAKKARTRVDAARLVLEVTGRHNPRGEAQAPNITVQIASVPRPDFGTQGSGETSTIGLDRPHSPPKRANPSSSGGNIP